MLSPLFSVDPIITVLGSEQLFQADSHADELRSILIESGIQFFEASNLFNDYVKSIDERQRYIVFSQHALEENEQMTLIPFTEKDTHLNDLIYRIFEEMKKTKTTETEVDAALDRVSEIRCPSGKYEWPSTL